MKNTVDAHHEVHPDIWDVAVIGAGVVGCAVTRRFALEGFSTVLLEKGGDILSGASKANSAILHTGFDAPENSLELQCMKDGYQEFLDIHERLNLPFLKTTALVAAWTDEQMAKLPGIVDKAHKNGVMDVCQISHEDVLSREPHLSKDVMGAVLVPGEAVIDPWSTPLAFVKQAVSVGAEVHYNQKVVAGDFDGSCWTLTSECGDIFKARHVINCAGLYGDVVENICHPSSFQIKPRKGQFLVLDKPAADLVNAIILPVPTEVTKGVLLSKTIFGNLLLGPTAEEQDDRDNAAVEEATLNDLLDQGERMLPGLKLQPTNAVYAGLRPATEKKEYRVEQHADKNWITVGGIRSTGLTSSLGLARHVYSLYQQANKEQSPVQIAEPDWPEMANLAEHLPRAYHQGGEIVCHCEMVTRKEIEDALNGTVPAGDIGGLKRRTRAMMGRCQGFYCGAAVSEMTKEHFKAPMDCGEVA